MKVNPDVERVIKDFHSNKKPIAACCIAQLSLPKCLVIKQKLRLV